VNAVRPQTTALILGAGGIARAGIYGLIQLGVRHIFISNRTLSHAENLARHYNEAAVESLQNSRDLESAISSTSRTTVHVIESICDPWPEGFRQPTIIVSCIPAHSIGGAPAANITLPDQWFKSPTGGVVIDVSTDYPPCFHSSNADHSNRWLTNRKSHLYSSRCAPRCIEDGSQWMVSNSCPSKVSHNSSSSRDAERQGD
jgi:hypothetical protein